MNIVRKSMLQNSPCQLTAAYHILPCIKFLNAFIRNILQKGFILWPLFCFCLDYSEVTGGR